jgi:hypothetical protein
MMVRSIDIKNQPGTVSVDPDNTNAEKITITFDKVGESVEADQSLVQEIRDLIKDVILDVFGIIGDAFALVLSPGTIITSAIAGKPPSQINDIVDKSADIAAKVNKFSASKHKKTINFTFPVIELNPLAACRAGYSVFARAYGTTTRGAGPEESATVRTAISWLGPLEPQGGINARAGTALDYTALAQLTDQSGEQAHADPSLDVTIEVGTDGGPGRHSEVQLSKVVFVINAIPGCGK